MRHSSIRRGRGKSVHIASGSRALALVVVLLGGGFSVAQDRVLTETGDAVVGNGIPNGIGASLGRMFLKAEGFFDARLELALSSDFVTVEPTTCAAASTDPCADRGVGQAKVRGNPTRVEPGNFRIKLGGAVYLPPGLHDLASGSSFEIALEGLITVGSSARRGAPCVLRLATAQAGQIENWAAESGPFAKYEYADRTGTSVLIADGLVYNLPGSLDGSVISNDGDTVLMAFEDASWESTTKLEDLALDLVPDAAEAARHGFPDGSFLLIEVNHSGFPSRSAVFPGATSNDVEVHVDARSAGARRFIRGDCNGDGQPDLGDAVFLLHYNFLGGRKPDCLAACDADGNGRVIGRVTDAIFLLLFLFSDGADIPPPYPNCGSFTEQPGATSTISCDESTASCANDPAA